VLAHGTASAQTVPGGIPPGGMPTTTNGQAPPPGTLPPTFVGGSGWGVPVRNPDGSIDQPFVQVNADGSREETWVHTSPPAATPEPDRTPAAPAAPASTNSGDRDVGGGMKERAGTGTNPVDRDVGGGMKERAGTGTDPVDREIGGGMKERAGTGTDPVDHEVGGGMKAKNKESAAVLTPKFTTKLLSLEPPKAKTSPVLRATVTTTVGPLQISHPTVNLVRPIVNVTHPTINIPHPTINIPVIVRR
jgi:hypothetical protein